MKTEILFNVASINTCTEAEGPGKRMAIWFQGCDKNCLGCCNPDFIPMISKNIMKLTELVGIIKQSKTENEIEGVTYLGGEPTLQMGLPALSKNISDLGLGVILFTGKQIDEIDSPFLSQVDLVIDGPYIESLRDTKRNLIGSSNQNIIFQTDRYKKDFDWFTKKRPKRVEVNIDFNRIIFTGDVF